MDHHTRENEDDAEGKALLRDLFPDLSEKQLEEIKEFLDGYCEIILRICEREGAAILTWGQNRPHQKKSENLVKSPS